MRIDLATAFARPAADRTGRQNGAEHTVHRLLNGLGRTGEAPRKGPLSGRYDLPMRPAFSSTSAHVRPRLLGLDFDGVLHPADNRIHYNSHMAKAPPPIALAQLRAQGRFCWLGELEDMLAPHPEVRLILHTTWRRAFSTRSLSEFLGSLGPRVFAMPPLEDLDASSFLREALASFNEDLVAQQPEQAEGAGEQGGPQETLHDGVSVAQLTLEDLLIVDDRPQFFEGDREVFERLVVTRGPTGIGPEGTLARDALRHWLALGAHARSQAPSDAAAETRPAAPLL